MISSAISLALSAAQFQMPFVMPEWHDEMMQEISEGNLKEARMPRRCDGRSCRNSCRDPMPALRASYLGADCSGQTRLAGRARGRPRKMEQIQIHFVCMSKAGRIETRP